MFKQSPVIRTHRFHMQAAFTSILDDVNIRFTMAKTTSALLRLALIVLSSDASS